MDVRLSILSLGFTVLASASYAEPIKIGDPSETYLCGEPGLWDEYSLTSDAIIEKTSMLDFKPFLLVRDASGLKWEEGKLKFLGSYDWPSGKWRNDLYLTHYGAVYSFEPFIGDWNDPAVRTLYLLNWGTTHKCYLKK